MEMDAESEEDLPLEDPNDLTKLSKTDPNI